MNGFIVPQDMNNQELAKKINAKAAVSMRDMLVLLGTSDEKLWLADAMREIRVSEPWRDGTKFVTTGSFGNMKVGYVEGQWHYFWTAYEYLDINYYHLDDHDPPDGIKVMRVETERRLTDQYYSFAI